MKSIVHFDGETQDPDDMFALCVLATHPRVDLKSVTLTPGGTDQTGLVRHVLHRLGRDDVRVGAWHTLPKEKSYVSAFHYKWLGDVPRGVPDADPLAVMSETLDAYPDAHLITGAALTNVADACKARGYLEHTVDGDVVSRSAPNFFKTWTCQGGFAGDSIVPELNRLEKFKGRETCPTFNLNGNPKAALLLLGVVPDIRMVSKNVCHGVVHGRERNERIPAGCHAGLDLLKSGMDFYFRDHPGGKALHDVLAVAAYLDADCMEWAPVKVYRERGEWGSRLETGSRICISTGINVEVAMRALEK